eukprot:gene48234-27648_t
MTGIRKARVAATDDHSGNILNLFMAPGSPSVTRVAVFAYAFALVLPIPVY